MNDCGCCRDVTGINPMQFGNPPGRSSLKYRIGTHGSFKSSMIEALQSLTTRDGVGWVLKYPALKSLTTREDSDLSIAFLDAWATIADVLTFYQERIANEGFLRTAKERKSVLELTRSVGYEVQHGVAASTFLAFTVEPAAVESTTIRTGTKVQSLAEEGQTAQTFETVEEIQACAEWNDLRPLQTRQQSITDNTLQFYFKGTRTLLKTGDMLLVVLGKGSSAKPKLIRTITKVDEDTESDITIVDTYWDMLNPTVELKDKIDPTVELKDKINLSSFFTSVPLATYPDKLAAELASKKWSNSDLKVISAKYGVSTNDLLTLINNVDPKSESIDNIRIFTFRIKAAIFGHNAPRYDSLSRGEAKSAYSLDTNDNDVSNVPINADNQDLIYLDNSYPSIIPSSSKGGTEEDSWLLLIIPIVGKANHEEAFRIIETREETIARFLLTGKVTGIRFDRKGKNISDFKIRSTNVFGKSEMLELAEIQIQEPVYGNTVTLDHALKFQLAPSQIISIAGDIVNDEGKPIKLRKSEIATISSIEFDGIFTKIILAKNLENSYKRDTLRINANLARATHGETRSEALGSGNPNIGQQEFNLKGRPLTYVHDTSSTGSKSTLEVQVNETIWKEVRSLFASTSNDHVYTTRVDEDGLVTIIFGDGNRGAKPNAGIENIKAKYRVGIGLAGLLKEGQLNLLMNRPLGVSNVTNPLVPRGAEDPESRDRAREHAPLAILAMNRIVSLNDVENFAITFAGVGKAKALWSWEGEQRVVRLTIASADGEIVDDSLSQTLGKAINKFKDPSIQVMIQPFFKDLFDLKAKVAVTEGSNSEKVILAVRNTLKRAYSFESRNFLQAVTSSEVIALIQGVDGVVAVDLDYLHIHGEEVQLNNILPTSKSKSRILGSGYDSGSLVWLLLLNPDGLELEEMTL